MMILSLSSALENYVNVMVFIRLHTEHCEG